MEDLIKVVAKDIGLDRTNLREFLNTAFNEVAKSQGWTADQFQSQASKMGEAFQYSFQSIMENLYPDIDLDHNAEIPEACMEGKSAADFAIYKGGFTKEGYAPRKLIAVIEAKGSPSRIKGIDENIRETPRPGMKRTDTVKKAICNAYQIKRTHPEALFFIVTSHKPKGGSAKCMCDLAKGTLLTKL